MAAKKKHKPLFGRIIIGSATTILVIFIATLLVSGYFRAARREMPSEAAARDSLSLEHLGDVKISILNGPDPRGIAETAKNYLRGAGFDVVATGNSPQKTDRTIIVNHYADTLAPLQVAHFMELGRTSILSRLDSSLYLNCTLILGSDYMNLKPFRLN